MSDMSEEKPTEEKSPPKKQEKVKQKKDKMDPHRFQGDGVIFKAKLIGTEDVPEARGDKMCQEAMIKLKAAVKNQGGHKQRLNIYVSLDGMKIYDEKSSKLTHHHAVHRVSFISRDVSDNRAFGYVCGDGDGHHKFYGIKTEKAAEHLVLTLRDLFQVVFELKKKEVELAKKSKDNNNEVGSTEKTEENVYEVPASGTPREITIVGAKDDPEAHIYEVPKSNAAVTFEEVKPESDPGVGTLLDLETELATISQGIAQMDAFSDPFTSFDSSASAYVNVQPNGTPQRDAWASPQAKPGITLAAHAQAAGTPKVDAWGSPTPQAAQVSFPPLGTQTNDPFVVPHQPGAIPVLPVAPTSTQPPTTMNAFTPAPTAKASFVQMSTPTAQGDPFKADPFFSSTPAQNQPGDKYAVFQDLSLNTTTSAPSNIFSDSTMFGSNVTDNTMNNAFATSGSIFDGPIQPLQPVSVQTPPLESTKSETKKNLFDDLNPISSSNSTKPPKEMFVEKQVPPKKSLNDIIGEQRQTPDFELQRQQSPNPFGGGVNVSVGLSNDPFQVNTDPFAVQVGGSVHKSSDDSNPFSVDPFGSPSSAHLGSTIGSDDTTNPFENDSFSQNRTKTPTIKVSPPPLSDTTESKSLILRTSDDFDLPSPDAPPPPLPSEVQVEFSDVAPAPPPRPRPKSNHRVVMKSSEVPKLSPPVPHRKKVTQKENEMLDISNPDTPSTATISITSNEVVEPADPFASDPFFTSPIPPRLSKSTPSDDPFAVFDAKVSNDSVSSDTSDPFNTPFSLKGQEPLYATVNKQKQEVDLL